MSAFTERLYRTWVDSVTHAAPPAGGQPAGAGGSRRQAQRRAVPVPPSSDPAAARQHPRGGPRGVQPALPAALPCAPSKLSPAAASSARAQYERLSGDFALALAAVNRLSPVLRVELVRHLRTQAGRESPAGLPSLVPLAYD